jgi:DNA-binding IclR family transcriptional regulator
MPGLRLTLAQAARLWQLDRSSCEALLLALVDEGFLTRTADGAFVSTPAETASDQRLVTRGRR